MCSTPSTQQDSPPPRPTTADGAALESAARRRHPRKEPTTEASPKPPTSKGPADTFAGDVWIDPITRGLPPSQLNVAAVTPGAWHSHDGGQTLYASEGRCLVQVRGQRAVELHPGDVIYAPDGEEHWHGATPEHFMAHLSITEGAPDWGNHVTDDEYTDAQPGAR